MKKSLYFLFAVTLTLGATGCGANVSEVEDTAYPARPINAVVPFGAGGGTDVWGRALMDGMAKALGTTITVTNVTGGSAGSTGVNQVWSAKHDGYTIACTSETPLTIPVMTALEQTSKDWIYFIAAGSPGVLMVNKNSEYDTMEEIMAQLEADPQSVSIAGTTGGLWFAQAKLFDSYGNMPFNWLPYDGSGAALKGAVAQEADCVVASAGEAKDFMRSGDLIPLAVMELEDWEMPEIGTIPSVTEYLPDLAQYLPLNQFLGFKVPADTAPEIVATLEEAFKATMETDTIKNFANEQLATIYNLSGEAAQEYAAQLEANLCWILNDMGTTTFSPDERGILR